MRRDILFGVAWFIGIFGYDAATSAWHLKHALNKVHHDPAAVSIVQRAVSEDIARVFLTYVIMGLVAGLVIWLARAVRGPARPWTQRLVIAGVVTTWMVLRSAILYPLQYIGMPGLDWWAGHVAPWQVDAALGLISLAWLLPGYLRHRPHPGWVIGLGAAVLGVALADNHLPATPAHKNDGPNVIILGVDALRPDHLRHYGYARDTVPALEAFMDKAAVFDEAVTPLPRTWPAWSTILTGVDPIVHGQRTSLPPPGDTRPDVPMITDLLKAAGYHTRFMTDDSRFSYMLPEHNFDVIDQPPVNIGAFALSGYDPHFRAFFTFMNGPLGWLLVPFYRYDQAFGNTWLPQAFAEHVADAIGEESRQDRFFLAMHTCILHAPGARTWPYHTMYDMDEYEGSNRYRYRSTGSKLGDIGVDDATLEAAEHANRQQNLDLYDAGLQQVEETLERIFRAIDDGDLWDNTLVIVLSDHGDDFLEDSTRYRYRGPNHGYHPWGTGQSRVVLAMRGADLSPGERHELVSLTDVAPTIARFTGLDLRAQGLPLQDPVPERVMMGETGVSEKWYRAEGHKTVPIANLGQRYAVDPETWRVYQRPEIEGAMIAAKDFWALDSRWWLTRETMNSGPRYRLFNWHADPTFADDLAAQHPAVVEHLSSVLSQRLGEAAPPEPWQPEPSVDTADEDQGEDHGEINP